MGYGRDKTLPDADDYTEENQFVLLGFKIAQLKKRLLGDFFLEVSGNF